MADTSPSRPAKTDKKAAAQPNFKPAKYGHYERQLVDFVRTATAKNIWYYRWASTHDACANTFGKGQIAQR
jgi:hypothetical protein